MKTIKKLSTFEKVQLSIMTVVMSTLVITVINWGINGFVSNF
jgi:cell division protein FtsL